MAPQPSILDDLGEEVTGIVSPVSICMAITVLLVRVLNPEGVSSSNTVYLASIAYDESVSAAGCQHTLARVGSCGLPTFSVGNSAPGLRRQLLFTARDLCSMHARGPSARGCLCTSPHGACTPVLYSSCWLTCAHAMVAAATLPEHYCPSHARTSPFDLRPRPPGLNCPPCNNHPRPSSLLPPPHRAPPRTLRARSWAARCSMRSSLWASSRA